MYSLGRDTFDFSNRNLQLSVGPSATREQLRTRVLAIPTRLNIMSFFKVRLCRTSARSCCCSGMTLPNFCHSLHTFVNGFEKVQAKSAFYWAYPFKSYWMKSGFISCKRSHTFFWGWSYFWFNKSKTLISQFENVLPGYYYWCGFYFLEREQQKMAYLNVNGSCLPVWDWLKEKINMKVVQM